MKTSPPPVIERAGYFGAGDRPLFGWLRAGGAGDLAGTGIVFCRPLGYEAIMSHRTLRAAALAAARRGAATLCFDYDGTGDSSGDDTDPERVTAWLASIDTAIDTLRRAAPLRRLCLWGVRAGALLAAVAAQRRGDVDLLIVTAPVADGKRFLREQRALAAAGDTPAPAAGCEEFAGFLFTAATTAALAALEIVQLQRPVRERVLLQHRDDLPPEARWPAAWREAGQAIDVQPFSGYEAMMRDPHRIEVPQAMIGAALDWLAAGAPAETTTSAAPAADALHDSAEVMPGMRELALTLGGEPTTFAIVTEPVGAFPASPPLLVLLNAGSVHHIGPNRMHVELARRLALQGVAVARIDLPGLGDARGHADAPENHPYPRHASDDLRRALGALRERFQPASVHGAGLCSGAYLTLALAAAEPLLDGATIINPLTYQWREGMIITMPDSKVVAESARYTQRALELSAWMKLFRGQVAYRSLLQVLARRTVQCLRRALHAGAAAVGLRFHSHLDRTLDAAATHGVRLRFVFADSDPGLAMLREQAGRTVARLQRRQQLHIDVIPGADHTFSHYRPRQQLLKLIRAAWDVPGGAA